MVSLGVGNGPLEGLIYKALVPELLMSAGFFAWTTLTTLTAGPNPQKASVLYIRRHALCLELWVTGWPPEVGQVDRNLLFSPALSIPH